MSAKPGGFYSTFTAIVLMLCVTPPIVTVTVTPV
jgi:hypothetical protein